MESASRFIGEGYLSCCGISLSQSYFIDWFFIDLAYLVPYSQDNTFFIGIGILGITLELVNRNWKRKRRGLGGRECASFHTRAGVTRPHLQHGERVIRGSHHSQLRNMTRVRTEKSKVG